MKHMQGWWTWSHKAELAEGRKEEHCLVQDEVKAAVMEMRTCRAVGINQQGVWSRWEEIV